MKHPLLLATLTLSIGMAAVAGLAAQSGETELDLPAIRARAAEAQADAKALSDTARARAAELHERAKASAQAGEANGSHYASTAKASARLSPDQPFDFDRLVADTADFDEARIGEAPRHSPQRCSKRAAMKCFRQVSGSTPGFSVPSRSMLCLPMSSPQAISICAMALIVCRTSRRMTG